MAKNCLNCGHGHEGDTGICKYCDTLRKNGPSEWIPNGTQNVKETVNHPNHYQSSEGLEAIDVIKAFTSAMTGIEAFDTGNAIKYICRWKHKNGIEDLKKAKWYLEHLINHIEKENE